MKLLVTGGAGFIGSNLVDKLVELEHEVLVLDNLRSGKKINVNPKASFFEVDICDKTKSEDVITQFKPEAIFHLAAQNEVPFSMDHPYEDQDINIVGTINLLEAARKNSVKKFIYSNTGGAFYGDVDVNKLPIKEDEIILRPTSFYGVSKLSAELYLKLYANLYGIIGVSLRYSNVYGPRQDGNKEAGVVAIFTEKLLKKERPKIFGDGTKTRDYVFVGDVVESNISALSFDKTDYFNISSGVRKSVNEVFDVIEEQLKTGLKPEHVEDRPGDAMHNSLDPSKAKSDMGWEPKVDFTRGIGLTLKHYQNNS